MPNIVTKQPYESFLIGSSIYDVQEVGEVVDLGNSTATAVDKDGTDVSTTFLDQSTLALDDDASGGTNNVLKIRIRSGTENGSPYTVTFKMQTSRANKYEVDVTVRVEEEP
jgi:hypothetical protein